MPLRPLLFVIPPFDFLEDAAIQDELIAGGVRDLMLGFFYLFEELPAQGAPLPAEEEGDRGLIWWPRFDRRPAGDEPVIGGPYTKGRFTRDYYATPRRGHLVAPFRPTAALYDGLGAVPPELPAGLETKSERLLRLVAQLSAKGIRIYTFGSEGPARWREEQPACVNNPSYGAYVAARFHDYYLHMPSLAGFVTDGPGYGYEITPGFRGGGQFFAPLCTCAHCQARARAMGVDLAAMQGGLDRLRQAMQGLTPEQVDLFLADQAGVFDAIDLFLTDPAITDLFRFKTASVQGSIAQLYHAIKAINPALEYGICPRLPCFTPMQGVNLRQLSQVTDFLQPKHYLWAKGIDGFRGTLARYIQTWQQWSPALDTERLEALISRLLGIELPPDYRIADFERPAPRSFFDTVVWRESRKMLQRTGDPHKLSPFLGLEHGGIWLNPEELQSTLQAMVDAGLTRFTYFILNSIDDDIWRVMTRFTAG